MHKPTLILILGLPATGKTTISRHIAEHFNLPLLVKDDIKEIMFDGLGWSDREWSQKVGRTAFQLLDYVVEQQLKSGHSIIVETPLRPEYENEKFQKWQADYGFHCIQVLCDADINVLAERFEARAKDDRHPGHVDHTHLEEFKAMLAKGKAEALDVKGGLIEVDTTDFSKVDERAIFAQIAAEL